MKWPTVSIDEITHVVTKGTTPTTMGRSFTDTGVTFIKAEALNGDVSLDDNGFAFIDEETHQSLKRSILQEGDILVTIAGAQVGRCGFVRPENLPSNTNQAVGIVRVDQTKANQRFVYYFFKLPSTFALCQSIGAAQAAQPNVNLGNLRGFQLHIPQREQQNKIADILTAYDDLMENNRRRMALLEESARLLYREWFIHLRFPGHEHSRPTQGIPEGWKKATAFDAMHVMSGGTPKTTNPDFWDGETPFYTPKDSVDACYVLDTEKHVTELGLSQCNSKLYPKDTLFITARGTVGNLNLAQRPMAMNQSCYALAGREGIPPKFLFCALREAIQHFKQHASGAVFDAIIVDTFKLIPFVFPNAKLVGLFEETVEPMFQQVENLLLQNQKLRAARDLLLPRLMSGEIAV
ncbi:restriction endonuclease subunit S [Prosthecobacter sp.]|uniref:restriction endonuclease subunit S n=1 Tax=Prosthecobacter sp. TaxID=1965333 RepID=UPI002ABA5020|nr:restriction endonuclease subunit S [Prosthecobacter sp.]MDZ4405855.1 restriction endonuclease subunit S [Prosthecobacter sp.]